MPCIDFQLQVEHISETEKMCLLTGRLINIGASKQSQNPGSGLVAYTAARYAVEGASMALCHEMAPHNIHVITLQPNGAASGKVFALPRIK
jgi:NAD(P)-dependent dehydrogenase (short-subunit alcohol dehydrogenase family)